MSMDSIRFHLCFLLIVSIFLTSGCSTTENEGPLSDDYNGIAPNQTNSYEDSSVSCESDGGFWCNDDCYSECPENQEVFCPESGEAYCDYKNLPEEGKYIILPFVDNTTGSAMKGDVYINGDYAGRAEDGVFYLFEDIYLNLTDDWKYQYTTQPEENVWDYYCLRYDAGSYGKDYEGNNEDCCFDFLYYEYDFELHEVIDNGCDFNESLLYLLNEGRGLVQPESVERFFDILSIENKTEKDLKLIHTAVAEQISYGSQSTYRDRNLSDFRQWQTPYYTLKNHHGNCIDYSLALISMMRLYNDSLDCYVMLLPEYEHAVPFCHLGDKLRIYEQDGYYNEKSLSNGPESEIRKDIESFLDSYFTKFDIPRDERMISGIFNDAEYYSFTDYNDEDYDKFIDWAIEKWHEFYS